MIPNPIPLKTDWEYLELCKFLHNEGSPKAKKALEKLESLNDDYAEYAELKAIALYKLFIQTIE